MALWIGQMISFIGDYFYFLAIPIVVNRLTGSALMVGLSAIAGALPALLLGPVAGVFVDRWDRRRTMLVSDIVRAVLSIRHTQATPLAAQAPTSVHAVWNNLRGGMRFLLASRTLVGILVCMSVIMLGLGEINEVWVPYFQRTFNVGAAGPGLVDSSHGPGRAVSGLALGFLSSRLGKKNMASGGIVICGLGLAAMGVAPAFWVSG